MAGKLITIQIRGLDADNGDVRFGDFIKELMAVRKALNETARIVTHDAKLAVDFKIVDLRHSSPAAVTLEAIPLRELVDAEGIVGTFFGSWSDIQQGQAPPNFDYPALDAFKEMTTMIGKNLADVVISSNGSTIPLEHSQAPQIDAILGPDVYEIGTVTGMMDKIHIHSGTNVFTIYPTSRQPKLQCNFPVALRTQAVEAVGQYATVYGQLKYKLRDAHPYEMTVRRIDVHPAEGNLPSLLDLWGVAPNATGDQLSEDWVRGIRNEW